VKLLALPQDHPFATHEALSWPQLRGQRFLVPKDGPGPEVQRHIITRLAEPGYHPDIGIHELATEDLLHLVSMGLGLMLTSESTAGARAEGVVLQRLLDDEPLAWKAVWLTSNRNPNLRQLLELARSGNFTTSHKRR
jgi:DNA-binding transcriptional LysR family regulator